MNQKLLEIQQMAQTCFDQLEKGNWDGLLEFESKQALIISELKDQSTNQDDAKIIQNILELNQKIMAKIKVQKERTGDELIALKRQQKKTQSYTKNFTND